jgi:hypothetical protein
MRRGALTVAGLAVVFVCVVAPAGAAAHDAQTVCQEHANTLVLTVQNGESSIGSATLYPRTRAHVTLCAEGEPAPTNTWSIAAETGLTVDSNEEDSYTVSVPDDRDEVVLNRETIDGRSPPDSLSITIQHGTGSDLDLAAEGLRFDDATAEEFRQASTEYRSARSALFDELAALNRTTESLETEGRAVFTSGNESTAVAKLSEVNETDNAVADNASAMKNILFEGSTDPLLPNDAYVATLENVEQQTAETNETVTDALVAYRSALTDVGASATGSIRQTTGLGLVVGLFVGALVGGLPVFRAGRKVQDFSDWRGTDFDRSVLRLPVAVGVGVVILGLVALVVTGIGGALL